MKHVPITVSEGFHILVRKVDSESKLNNKITYTVRFTVDDVFN